MWNFKELSNLEGKTAGPYFKSILNIEKKGENKDSLLIILLTALCILPG